MWVICQPCHLSFNFNLSIQSDSISLYTKPVNQKTQALLSSIKLFLTSERRGHVLCTMYVVNTKLSTNPVLGLTFISDGCEL